MRIVSQEVKDQVCQFVRDNPGLSYTKIGERFGVDRHSISFWLGVSDRYRDGRRAWQKDKAGKAKFILIQFLGGCCVECGYHGDDSAIDFHHKVPAQKDKQVSDLLTGSFDIALEETKKCDLLCCRCHREKHSKESTLGPNGVHSATQ